MKRVSSRAAASFVFAFVLTSYCLLHPLGPGSRLRMT